ncbi:hypothetical protein DET61_11920 [Marinobacter nauticus]|uniref:MafI family immunity protein n=1 Tax=Marinobacter nauticus TaxID=2743 RepID=A0A368X5N4_MARNT|nr:MafI family immunity protein [Marinobacter nauticus]RCW63253.1 hypothetical protein DET61_11920 [Marinobacter nauticus]
MMNDYQKIENALGSLLAVLADSFTESEFNEVKEFIDAGEYGIALETLIDIIEDESKSISKEALLLAKKAGECMDMDSNTIEKRVSRYVKKTG